METRKLSFEEMERVEGGGAGAGAACGILMGAWGVVLAYGAAAAVVTAGVSAGIAAVWGGLTVGLCWTVSR
jgi:hypothetical protein